MENKKKKYTIITLSIIVLILLVIGISYALWIITKEQTGENVVNSACLDVTLDNEKGDISLLKTFPILDSEGEKLKPYKFTIHNNCSDIATYQINLESLSEVLVDDRLNPDYIKVKLNEEGQEGIKDILGSISITDTTIANTYEAHKLMSGYLEGNETKNFELRLWVDEKVTIENKDAMNKEFKSKISVTSTYINEEDVPPTSSLALSVCDDTITATATATPYKNKSIQKYEYQIDEEEWQDGSETQKYTVKEEGEHTIKLRVTDNLGVTSEVEQKVNIVLPKMIEIAGKQIPVVTCKNGLYKVEHDVSEISSGWNKTEYRYAGVNPNNYVSFNNEIWRIIGLVNVKTESGIEQRLKIVRQNEIEGQKDFGSYSWDRKTGYSNNWTKSKLKDMLNGIYYESGIGECYIGDYGKDGIDASECDFNSGVELPKGLDDTARSMIDKDVIWNIGGWLNPDITAKEFYEKERGTSTGNSNTYPSEWSKETDALEKHNGIGLMYISDYGYAVGGEVRNNCLTKKLHNDLHNDYRNDNCGTNDWLKPNYLTWTLSLDTSDPYHAYYVHLSGGVGTGYHVHKTFNVLPTLYLSKNVSIVSDNNDGSINKPYNLNFNV